MNQLLSIEAVGADIEAAIEKGVADLGVSREQVMVEVLEEPSRRLLGLGMRQARVRLTVIRAPEAPATPQTADTDSKATKTAETAHADDLDGPRKRRPRSARPKASSDVPAPVATESSGEKATQKRSTIDMDVDFEDDEVPPSATPEQLADEAQIGAAILRQMLQKMGFIATVTAEPAVKQSGEAQHWTLQITGKDVSVLLARRAEALASLQYLVRLMTSREIGHRAHLVVDVEGYKVKREEMLRRLALRMAEQAIQRGRAVAMEPMPPHERRIIHLTLRDNPNVTTESVGEGDQRKVTVVPRKPQA
ncbi:MAG: hypothetical protein OHK0023_27980 [Anaerolineae bacterium]